MPADNCNSLVLLELFVVGVAFFHHVGQGRVQVLQLNLTVNIFIFVFPPAIPEEMNKEWTLSPISFFEYSIQPVKMDLLSQYLLLFFGVLDLGLADELVLDWPVEPAKFDVVMIFVHVNQLELIFDTSDDHWLR